MHYVYLYNTNLTEIILALNALYSYAIEQNIRIKVSSIRDTLIRELLITFHYHPVLIYGKMKLTTAKNLKNKMRFNDIVDLKYFQLHHKKSIGFTDILFLQKVKEIVLPFNKIVFKGKTNSSCFQFDFRNTNINKMKKIVGKFGKIDSVCVGGRKSKNYFEYRLNHFDNIRRISQTILSCNYFFGSDAGMANLAGTIGIPAKIILQEKEPIIKKCKKEMYDFFYKDFLYYDNNLKLL